MANTTKKTTAKKAAPAKAATKTTKPAAKTAKAVKATKAVKAEKVEKPAKAVKATKAVKPAPKAPAKAVKAPAKAVKAVKATPVKAAKPAPKAPVKAVKVADEATFKVHSAPTTNVVENAPLFFERLPKMEQVGHPLTKIDAMGLVTGTQKYVADIEMPKDLLYIKVLGSPHAHARIKKIDTTEAKKMPGVVAVYTYKDVPRVMRTTAGQGFPEPSPYDTPMLDNKVRYVGDRVAIVAAETPEQAVEACRKIKVDYEVLPAVLDTEEAMTSKTVIHDEKDAYVPIPIYYEPKHNHCSHVETSCGEGKDGKANMDKGFKDADKVIERKYYPHYAHHCPMEPHVCMSYLDENNRLVLRTSTQVPWHARRITAQTLGIPIKKIRVIKPRVGGAFGTKQEVLLEDVCGIVTLRTRRPALYAMTREEEFMESRTRHPMVVKIKMGAKKDGTITALSMRIISNTGAYGSHALTVLSNCGSKVLPLYHANNIEFIGDTVYTNLPVGGAYRGYGATQACFGTESMMDEMAAAIGMDPIKFRQKNHIKPGESSPIIKALGEGREGVDMIITSVGLPECIEKGKKLIDWDKKYAKYAKEDKTAKKVHGVGMCCLMQGSSIPEVDMGSVFIKMNEDGSFNMNLGATDLGTGSDTVMAQIAAETIGCKHEDIIVYSSDTDMTPFDVGAYASSTTYLTGGATINAAKKVRDQIVSVAALLMGEKLEDITIKDSVCYGKNKKNKVTFSQVANCALYGDDMGKDVKKMFQIGAIGSHISHASPPPFAAHFAEVEIDTETGDIELLHYVAGCDCGTAINPQLALGQVQGGAMNSISFALTEEYNFDKNGRMQNPTFANYKIWTARDLNKFECFLADSYEQTGPYGAKSVSEININGALPCIANAICNAVGVRLVRPPFTAEKIWRAMQEKKEAEKKAAEKPAKAAKTTKAAKAEAKPAKEATKKAAKKAAPAKKSKK